jgi:mRNA interferase MazF
MNSGEIVLVHFPFTNLESTKKRPALALRQTILSKKTNLVTIAMITSQVEGIKLEGDVFLDDWEDENLLYPSIVRLSKVSTVEVRLIEKEIGKLSKADFENVKKGFKQLFHHWLK